jgi:hypothetical protein
MQLISRKPALTDQPGGHLAPLARVDGNALLIDADHIRFGKPVWA